MPWRSWSPLSISSRMWSSCCGVSLGLRSNFTAPALHGFDPRADAFADEAALKLGQEADHLPHSAACRLSVSMCSVSERNLTP
jgi:hypothetical protein